MSLSPEIITGLPSGVKEAGQRVDFKPNKFDLAIQTKGYRAWWSRAGICPCRNNTQTDQADVNCPICHGTGWFFYVPELGLADGDTDAYGNPVEVKGDAVSIMAILTSATLDPQIYERFGEWTFGTIKVTTQAPNTIGYRDRLVLRDTEMVWGQLIEFDGGSTISVTGGRSNEGLRYPVVRPILLCSVSSTRTNYVEGSDYQIEADGSLTWLGTVPSVSMLFFSYRINPVFRIADHVFAFRDTLVAAKTHSTSKAEQHRKLPIHAMAKLDFLMDD